MGKKVVLAVFGGIALLGLVMSIVGWAMGGRPGHLEVSDGDMVYYSGQESVRVGSAPGWAGRLDTDIYPVGGVTDVEYSEEYVDDYYDDDNGHHGDYNESDWHVSGEEISVDGEAQSVPLDFSIGELSVLDVDIDAGYIVIKEGEELSFTVKGPLAYDSHYSGGVWEVSSQTDLDRVHTRHQDGATHFYRDGKDVTTVFTITLPKGSVALEADLGMGVMTVKNVETGELDLSLDLGSMQVKDSKTQVTELSVDLGNIETRGLNTKECNLEASLGNIDFGGSVSDILNVSCDLGNVSVSIPRPAGGYYAYTNVDLGAVTVDGIVSTAMSSGSFGEESSEGSGLQMDLSCELGAVNVNFTE